LPGNNYQVDVSAFAARLILQAEYMASLHGLKQRFLKALKQIVSDLSTEAEIVGSAAKGIDTLGSTLLFRSHRLDVLTINYAVLSEKRMVWIQSCVLNLPMN